MKCRGLLFWGGIFWAPSGDPEEILSSEGSEDAETSPPCGASLWLGVEDLQKGQKMQKPPLHVVQAYGWEWKTSWV